jgi:hypothetical protein
MTKWPHHPNLRKKPHAPSKGRGPVQRAIRRAFMASGAEVLNSTEIYDWAHGRRRFGTIVSCNHCQKGHRFDNRDIFSFQQVGWE